MNVIKWKVRNTERKNEGGNKRSPKLKKEEEKMFLLGDNMEKEK